MKHSLAYYEETETDIVFRCVKCLAVIGFNKPGIGEPAPSQDPATLLWSPPDNPDQWMVECDVADSE